MLEELFVKYCSPTLAGLKTGNMFNCSFENMNELEKGIKYMNSILNGKGVYVCSLSIKRGRALIYVFRPHKLMCCLNCSESRKILEKEGYVGTNIEENVEHLSKRICMCKEFPHEIGLFLGYPVEDVKGFIENRGRNCKCCGCWKVYANECEAVKTFAKFKKCTDVYCRKLREGSNISKLTIRV